MVTLNVTRAVAPPPVLPSDSSESGDSSVSEANSENSEAPPTPTNTPATTASLSPAPSINDSVTITALTKGDSDDEIETGPVAEFTTGETESDFFGGDAQQLDLRDASSVRISTTDLESSIAVAPETDNSFRNSLRFDGEDLSYLVSTEFIQELEQVEGDLEFNGAVPEWATGTAVATTASLSVGYIMWMLRGGYVLASVLSTMPVWQNIDPLPVLAALESADDDDDESLETMIDRASDEADDSEIQVAEESTVAEMRKEEAV